VESYLTSADSSRPLFTSSPAESLHVSNLLPKIRNTDGPSRRPADRVMGSGMQDAVRELIATFNDLNSPAIEELPDEPSPLEFMRYVAKNRPFVLRGGAASWFAVRNWNADSLVDQLSGEKVNIAVTPNG
jgi:hypothetical protein